MGLCLVHVPELQPGLGGGEAPAQPVLHPEALAAQQVREAELQPGPPRSLLSSRVCAAGTCTTAWTQTRSPSRTPSPPSC